MKKLVEKYAIAPLFLERYFGKNADNRLAVSILEFMLWRRGSFIHPKDKVEYHTRFMAEEIESFYAKNEISIPQIEFAITTRCTLRCVHCNNLIPHFTRHVDLSANDFKKHLDILAGATERIRKLIFIGGEPLMNISLPEMVRYAAQNLKIGVIEIITNGTLLPTDALLNAVSEYSHKTYFFISNYSKNEAIRPMLKHDEIMKRLKTHGIKYQMFPDFTWTKETGLKDRGYSDDGLRDMFFRCRNVQCNQVLDGKMHVCPKAAAGHELGIVPLAEDFIDLRTGGEREMIRRQLEDFYTKDYFEACKYCLRLDEQVLPAIQI